jgi:hypothetical protein
MHWSRSYLLCRTPLSPTRDPSSRAYSMCDCLVIELENPKTVYADVKLSTKLEHRLKQLCKRVFVELSLYKCHTSANIKDWLRNVLEAVETFLAAFFFLEIKGVWDERSGKLFYQSSQHETLTHDSAVLYDCKSILRKTLLEAKKLVCEHSDLMNTAVCATVRF